MLVLRGVYRVVVQFCDWGKIVAGDRVGRGGHGGGSRLSVVARKMVVVFGGFLPRWWFYVVKTGPRCGSRLLVLFLYFFHFFFFFFVGLNLYVAYLSLSLHYGSGFGGVLFWFWNCYLKFDFV